jgi:LEA14-like dessication related protein
MRQAFFNIPMLRTLKIALIISPILLVIFGCLSYEEVTVVEVADVEFKEMSADGITVDIHAQISNPNNYKISVVKTNLMLLLNGANLGKAHVKNNLVLPKHSDDVHKITVNIKGSQLKAALPSILLSALGGEIKMRIKGTITARARMLRKKIEVDFTESAAL